MRKHTFECGVTGTSNSPEGDSFLDSMVKFEKKQKEEEKRLIKDLREHPTNITIAMPHNLWLS